MTTDSDDILAAEHVLGLLGPEAEAIAVKRAAEDPDFAGRVAFWSDRLDVADPAEAAAAPDSLFDAIEQAIGTVDAAPGTRTLLPGDGVWEALGPGIERRLLHVDRADGTQSYFVRMQAGASLPLHSHRRTEQCVVLKGRLRIGDGEFGAGSFHLGFAGNQHSPIHAVTDAEFFIHGEL